MIPPREQWCIQIDVTDACQRKCSNCTRLTGHGSQPYFMPLETFRQCCEALRRFPLDSPSDPGHWRQGVKCVGIMGGEPLLHPAFPELCRITGQYFAKEHRGLWTGMRWRETRHADVIRDTFTPLGYINLNVHAVPSLHQPVLVAARDAVKDEAAMWELIRNCPLQREWSGSMTPKGFFFCEVAAAMDRVFHGPGGLPIEEASWRKDIDSFRDQIERWCPRCGVCVPLDRRFDCEERDDVSRTNLDNLRALGSRRIANGQYVLWSGDVAQQSEWEPLNWSLRRNSRRSSPPSRTPASAPPAGGADSAVPGDTSPGLDQGQGV